MMTMVVETHDILLAGTAACILRSLALCPASIGRIVGPLAPVETGDVDVVRRNFCVMHSDLI